MTVAAFNMPGAIAVLVLVPLVIAALFFLVDTDDDAEDGDSADA